METKHTEPLSGRFWFAVILLLLLLALILWLAVSTGTIHHLHDSPYFW